MTFANSFAINWHCNLIVCNECLHDLLDFFQHCFHNRYPFFFFVNTWASPGSSFILFPTRGWSNYLPISMWLLTLIALAIIIATTASAITVVIIICFLSQSLWSRRIFGLLFYMLSFYNLSYLKPSISCTWDFSSFIYIYKTSHLAYSRSLVSSLRVQR